MFLGVGSKSWRRQQENKKTTPPPSPILCGFGKKSHEYIIHKQDKFENFTEMHMVNTVWPFANKRKEEILAAEHVANQPPTIILPSAATVSSADIVIEIAPPPIVPEPILVPSPSPVSSPNLSPSPSNQTAESILRSVKDARFDDLITASPTMTIKDISVMEHSRRIAPYVCRIDSNFATGTGFLLSDLPGCIISNSHVFSSHEFLKSCTFSFFSVNGARSKRIKYSKSSMMGYQVVFPEKDSSLWNKVDRWFAGLPPEYNYDSKRWTPDIAVIQFQLESAEFDDLAEWVNSCIQEGHPAPPFIFTDASLLSTGFGDQLKNLAADEVKQLDVLLKKVMKDISAKFGLPETDSSPTVGDAVDTIDSIQSYIETHSQGVVHYNDDIVHQRIGCVHFGSNDGTDRSCPPTDYPRQHAVLGKVRSLQSTTVDSTWAQTWEKWQVPVTFDSRSHKRNEQLPLLQILGVNVDQVTKLTHAFITHTAAVRPGASGAPLFNGTQIIGVHFAGVSAGNIKLHSMGLIFSPLTLTILGLFRFKLLAQHPNIKKSAWHQLFARMSNSIDALYNTGEKELQKNFCPIRPLASKKKLAEMKTNAKAVAKETLVESIAASVAAAAAADTDIDTDGDTEMEMHSPRSCCTIM